MKSFKKKIAVLLTALLATGSLPLGGLGIVNAAGTDNQEAVDHLIINQVYGGGGKSDTPITNSFIELYNPTDENVSLSGYSIVSGSDQLLLTTGETIESGKSYLIVCNSEITTDDYITYDLPEADQTWEYTISNKSYSISLMNGENEVDKAVADQNVDALKISKQKSLRRIDHADTDTNSDWEIVVWQKGSVTVNEEYVNQYAPYNSKGNNGNVHTVSQPTVPAEPTEPDNPVYTPVVAGDTKVTGFNNGKSTLDMEQIARYNQGAICADGGSLEIVEYNSMNGYAYAVSGLKGKIATVRISNIANADKIINLSGTEYDVKELVAGKAGFVYGDITSVSISPNGKKLAAAVQHADYDKAGIVAIFDCNTDGSLTNPSYVEVGVQPDMVLFANDNTILTADEGEPRNGYDAGCIDPKGSVSIVDVSGMISYQAGFEEFTKEELVNKHIILGIANGEVISPEYDLEPEYIVTSADGKTAYVSLQEANAIAVLDLSQKKFTGIYSVGYEDYSKVAVDIVEDGKYEAKTYDNLVGARMPDGIAIYENDGNTYLITANEGDAREWGSYINELKTKEFTGKNIRVLNPNLCEGLPSGKSVMYGGRGFSVFEVASNGLIEVYDSGNDFERITSDSIPEYFNCSNDDIDVDSRSPKKGPEPENVIIGKVKDKTYAFVAVERIGGIMVYDITNPVKTTYVNYINSREFGDVIMGDVSPEGLCFVDNGTAKNPMIIAACEVSGTLAVYELKAKGQYAEEEKDPSKVDEDKPGNSTIEKPEVTVKVGSIVEDTKTKAAYKVTSTNAKNKTVQYLKTTNRRTKKITIPTKVTIDGVTYKVTAVAQQAFLNNRSVTQIIVGKNITTIGSKAFKGCKKLTRIKMYSSVTRIGSNAFEGCTSLKSITIPSNVRKLGSNIFKNCKKLRTINIRSIYLTKRNTGKYAFKGVSSRAIVKVPRKKLSSYKKLFKGKGLNRNVVVYN